VPQRIRAKLTYANLVSTFCLFLLMGGGVAYASSHLSKNSVGAGQLKKGAVTPPKVATATIRLFEGQKGAPGTPGSPGPQGTQGLRGPAGPTAAAAGGVDTPAANFDFAALPPQTVTVPSAGDLFAMGSIQSQVNCSASASACTLQLGLYVDGLPVAGTLREESAKAGELSPIRDIDMFGISAAVAAGTHTVTIGVHKTTANGVDNEFHDSIGGILLGD
jgi:hypothetical protein